MLTVPAVTENVVEFEPCGTVTVTGTFAAVGAALIPTDAPPLGAADVSATVQVDPTDGVNDAGLHERLLKTGVCRIVTVPPLTDVDNTAPAESADRALASCGEDETSCVDAATARVTDATTPLERAVESKPQTTQVAVPAPLLQERVLPAAPEPSVKVADVKSVVE